MKADYIRKRAVWLAAFNRGSPMPKHLEFSDASFLTSADRLSGCPADVGAEIAFCGRSNAGKSSALNYLTRSRNLARTSKTPGRTQLINFFALADDVRLVDLPGYGYAKVPQKLKADWHRNIDTYLRSRDSLVGLVAVMDIRHPLKEFDEMMIAWASEAGLGVHVVLTKCDKLKSGARKRALTQVENELPPGVTVQVLSATHDIGRDALEKVLRSWLTGPDEDTEPLVSGVP